MAIRDNTKGTKKSKLFNQAITAKEFGQFDNGGQDSMTWANREKDWYNAERRFIFASHTKKDATKWMKHLLMDQVKRHIQESLMQKL